MYADSLRCTDCDLTRENTELKHIVAKQQKVIERQRRVIEAVMIYAADIYNRAATVLSQRSGVPRGTWSLARGEGEVAREVYNRLSGGI